MGKTEPRAQIRILRRNLMLGFAVFSAAIIAGALAYHNKFSRSTEQNKSELLSSIAKGKVAEIAAWRKDNIRHVNSLVDNPIFGIYLKRFLNDPSDKQTKDLIQDRLEALLRNTHYKRAYIAGISGEPLISAGAAPQAQCPDARNIIKSASGTRGAVIGDLHISPSGEVDLHVVSVAASSPAGNRIFVVVSVDPSLYLYPLVQDWPTPSSTAETLLIRREGDEILFLNELRHRKDTALKLKLPVTKADLPATKAVDGYTGIFKGRDYRDQGVLAYTAHIPGSNWAFVAKIDQDEVFSDLTSTSTLLLLLVLSLLGAGAAATLYFFNRQAAGYSQVIDKAEADLRESEQIFSEFMKHSPVHVFFKDEDMRTMRLSNNFETLLGRPLQELIGKSMDELFPSDLAKAMVADDKRILKQGREEVVEEDFNGRSYRTIKFPITLEGRPPYMAGFTMDITDQKKYEADLAHAAERLKLATDSAGMGIWDWDIPADILEWDDRMLGLYGLKNEGFKGAYESWLEGVHPDDRPRCEEAIEQALNGEKVYDIDFRVIWPDGSVRHIKANGIVFRDPAGKPLRMVGVNYDITERKLAHEKILQEKARTEAYLDIVAVMIMVLEKDQTISLINRKGCEILGYTREEIIGKNWFDLAIPQEQSEMVKDAFNKIISGDLAPVEHFENEVVTKNGERRIISWSNTVRQDPDGSITGILTSGEDITERRGSEAELRRSRATLQAALASMTDAVFISDPGATFVEYNEAFATFHKFRDKGECGRHLADFQNILDVYADSGELLPLDMWVVARALRGDSGSNEEYTLRRKDTGETWAGEYSYAPIRDASGGIAGSVVVARDITERKNREAINAARLHLMQFAGDHTLDELLEETINEAEKITGSLVGFYHFIDEDQKALTLQAWSTRTKKDFCNAEGKSLHYGIDKAGVWVDCFHARKPVIHNDYSALAHKKGLPPGHAPIIRQLVVPVMRNDRVMAILGAGNKPKPYTDKDVEAISLLADLAWEITERKIAEEKLRQANIIMANTQSLARVGGWEWDLSKQTMHWTEETYHIHGLEPGNIKSGPETHIAKSQQCYRPEDLPKVMDTFKLCAETGEPYDLELPFTNCKGRKLWVRTSAKAEKEGGRIVRVIGALQDITTLKQAELKLTELNRSLSDSKREMENFLYITTHDLRSPLVNIQGFSQNLQGYLQKISGIIDRAGLAPEDEPETAKLTKEDIPKALKFILNSSDRMDRLITALLKVSRLGRVEMKPEALAMDSLIEKIASSLSYQLGEAGGRIKCGPLPPCMADQAAVTQLFTNLLDNAIKYRSNERDLLIEVNGAAEGNTAHYTIKDNGSGIPAADQEKIWNVFYRPERPNAERGEGIGLPTVRRIAEKNGGTIRVESKEGEGSIFHLELPAPGEGKQHV